MSREEERRYENDVWYEVWRHGGDPDRINFDRIDEHFDRGYEVDQSAQIELRKQHPPQETEED